MYALLLLSNVQGVVWLWYVIDQTHLCRGANVYNLPILFVPYYGIYIFQTPARRIRVRTMEHALLM